MSAPTGYTKLGLVGYSHKGDYSSTTTYNRYNCVNYQGTTFVALQDNLRGVTPVKGASWDILAQGVSTSYVDSKVADLNTKIEANTTDIATNTSDINTNKANIATNTSDINTNKANIATNTSNINTNKANIATNASNITALNTNLTNTSTTVYIPTYGTGVTAINDTDKVRIYKDTRNVKYMTGAFTVNTAVSDGSTVLVIPTDALPSFSNQIWVSVQHISTGRCYNLLFPSKNITFWGATSMPTGSYSINCVYI